MKIYITLNKLKDNNFKKYSLQNLLSFLNKTNTDDAPLDLLTILESNGVVDCVWAFRCTDNDKPAYRHIAADFAESVLHIYEERHPNDYRPRIAIQAARDYANDLISKEELTASWIGATDSAKGASSSAAWGAASAAASCVSWSFISKTGYISRAARRSAYAVKSSACSNYTIMEYAEKQRQILIKYLS